MNFRKQRLTLFAIGAALMAVVALPAAAQDLKIGVVNFPALLQSSPQTKVAMDALQAEFAPRQREYVAKQKELKDLTDKIQKDVAVMGETERQNADKDVRDLRRDVTRMESELREDLNLRQNEELAKLQKTLQKEVQDYADKEHYDLVLGDGVLYASKAVNITEQVLQVVEANFKASTSKKP